MNLLNNQIAEIGRTQLAADQNAADGNVLLPAVAVHAGAWPKAFRVISGPVDGGATEAIRAASTSFIAGAYRSRTNQAAADTNAIGLGPGIWDVSIEIRLSTDWALLAAETWTLDLMDQFATRTTLWRTNATGAIDYRTFSLKYRWAIPHTPFRDNVIFGNEWSLIFNVPASGAGQTNLMALYVSAAKLL